MMNVSDSLVDGQEQDQAGAARPAIYRPHDNARPTVKELRLSRGLTSSIRDRARQEGTTVHGALCAALVLASREFAAWRKSPFASSRPSTRGRYWVRARVAASSLAPPRACLTEKRWIFGISLATRESA